MNVLITGASGGIGGAAVRRFLDLGHAVFGLDRQPAGIEHPRYRHFQVDLRQAAALPDLPDTEVILHCAGTQQSEDDLGNNLLSAMHVTEKYACSPALQAVVFVASASAVTGQEFAAYVAAKAGLVGYMRHLAIKLAPRGAVCNALSFGGVYTPLNDPVVEDPALFARIMAVTPLKKWMTPEECADWIEFMALKNRSMSGQNLLIDNGERDLNPTFVWPEEERI